MGSKKKKKIYGVDDVMGRQKRRAGRSRPNKKQSDIVDYYSTPGTFERDLKKDRKKKK